MASVTNHLSQTLDRMDHWLQNKKIHFSWDIKSKWELSLILCGDMKIRSLNMKFRNKDKVTDVLSFPLYQSLRTKRKELIVSPCLGEIVIAWPQCQKQAKQFLIDDVTELQYLFAHGFLHLIGFDHEISKKEYLKMQKEEDFIMSREK